MIQSSLLDPEPTLTAATYNSLDIAVRLHFDKAMLELPVAGNNLFARYNDEELPLVFDKWEKPFRARYEVNEPGVDFGDDIVSYIDAEMKFLSADVWPLDFFTDFPLLLEPTFATLDYWPVTQFLRITFDIDMLEEPIDGSQFFFRINNEERTLTFNQWQTSKAMLFDTAVVGADVGADELDFLDGFMPFKSAPGAPLPDFTGEPVTPH